MNYKTDQQACHVSDSTDSEGSIVTVTVNIDGDALARFSTGCLKHNPVRTAVGSLARLKYMANIQKRHRYNAIDTTP